MGKQRRSCPRGLYDGCPIPRELCTDDHTKSGEWHCLGFLKDFERFLFGTDEMDEEDKGGDEIVSLEDLMRVLQEEQ